MDIFAEEDAPEFVVRKSSRARNLSVHVHPGGHVEIVAPARARPRDVEAFVKESSAWIRRARRKLKNEQRIDYSLPREIRLPAVNRELRVEYGATEQSRPYSENQDGTLLRLAAPAAHRQKCRLALRAWLAVQGKAALVPWLRRVSQEIAIDYRRTQVRGQKTRWGSCSSSGTISLNFCLLFLAPELVRYLFIHELCHRRQFNHSARYWRLVASFEPMYEELDRRLADAWRDVPGWALAR